MVGNTAAAAAAVRGGAHQGQRNGQRSSRTQSLFNGNNRADRHGRALSSPIVVPTFPLRAVSQTDKALRAVCVLHGCAALPGLIAPSSPCSGN